MRTQYEEGDTMQDISDSVPAGLRDAVRGLAGDMSSCKTEMVAS